jgi:glycosyltransferase involved in cell wall biosynthesis
MTTDAVGGVWTYATTLAHTLCERGYRVTLVSLGPGPRADQLAGLTVPGLEFIATDLALEWMDPDGEDAARAREVLVTLERRLRPDVVHLNSFREANAGWHAPVLVAAHSCVGSWWRACRGEEAAEARWRHYAQAVRAGLQCADTWIAPTASFRDEIQRRYAPTRDGHVIWNGIGSSAAGYQKQPFILAAGRLWDEAKHIRILGDVGRNVDWPIRLAGSLRAQDGPMSCPHGVQWLGELPHSALQASMQQAAIFVSPALYEPFGLTVLEAAAAGCALVLSDIASFRELWDGAAHFVDPRDGVAIAAALNMLTRDAGRRRRLQESAVQRASRYSVVRTADATAALYEKLIASCRPHNGLELCA